MTTFNWRYSSHVRLITTNSSGVYLAAGSSQAFNVNRFSALGSQVVNNTGETNNQMTVLVAKTFSGLWLNIVTNTTDGATTVTFRKNAADANQTISITAATTGTFEDTTHSDAIAAGDLVDYKIATTGTAGSININVLSMLWNIPAPAGGGGDGYIVQFN